MIQVDDNYVGIGGGDIAAILGLDEFRKPSDVWRQLKGDEPRSVLPENDAMYWGVRLEPVVADDYAKKTGAQLRGDGRARYAHESRPWHTGRPDRQVVKDGVYFGLEVKTTNQDNASAWGPSGSAEVPDRVACQCHWYMSLADADRWDVAVLIGGQDFRTYSLFRNDKVEKMMLARAEAFWRRVQANDRPVDETEEAEGQAVVSALAKTANRIIPAPESVARVMAAMVDARSRRNHAESELEALREHVAQELRLHDARGFSLPDGTTIRVLDVQPRIRHKALSMHLLQKYEVDFATRLELTLKFAGPASQRLHLHVKGDAEKVEVTHE